MQVNYPEQSVFVPRTKTIADGTEIGAMVSVVDAEVNRVL